MKFDFPKGKGSNVKLGVYVPSTKSFDKPISIVEFDRRVALTRRFLNSAFGGTSTIRAVGSYQFKGKTIKEKVAVVETFTKPRDYDKADLKIKSWLQGKKAQWGQDSLGYEFEGSLYFI